MDSSTPAQPAEAPVIEADAVDPELAVLHAEMVELKAQGENGANWFYWIAGLSLVNTMISLFNGGISFVVGLAVTVIADAVGQQMAVERPEAAMVAKGMVLVFSLFVAAVVVGFGWLSNKRILPVFALGMFLYLLDGLLYLWMQQWLSVGFHAFALFNMGQGLVAYRKLSKILKS